MYIMFVELAPKMLHTKFKGNGLSGTGVGVFLRFITMYVLGGHLDHVIFTNL